MYSKFNYISRNIQISLKTLMFVQNFNSTNFIRFIIEDNLRFQVCSFADAPSDTIIDTITADIKLETLLFN